MLALVLSLTFVSAMTIYSGESIELELEKPFEYYSIVGNSTAIDLEVTQEGNIVTIIPNKYSQTDEFEIIFFDTLKETITIHTSSGGGGGGTRTIYKDKEVIKYLDRTIEKIVEVEVKVHDGNLEVVEEESSSMTGWIGNLILICLGLAVVYFAFKSFKNPSKSKELKQEEPTEPLNEMIDNIDTNIREENNNE